ncbi:uncharacterized protein LOC123298995 [Chrysoperla carnea]|uniref:uncharacterized protein LOC123298995 n=1 Tax=Chrysoperla carnea TaxID=189513 RepID=UPI001D09666C|nr:uncharacterized protein LOC123298995 [Chrysoperla carnea]
MAGAVVILLVSSCSIILGHPQHLLEPSWYENNQSGSLPSEDVNGEENRDSGLDNFADLDLTPEVVETKDSAAAGGFNLGDLEYGQCARIGNMEYCHYKCPYRNPFLTAADDVICNCMYGVYRICEKTYNFPRTMKSKSVTASRRNFGPLIKLLNGLIGGKKNVEGLFENLSDKSADTPSVYRMFPNEGNNLPDSYVESIPFPKQKHVSKPNCGKKIRKVVWQDACAN